jgi:hypothetical protein
MSNVTHMKSFKQVIAENVIWIITTLVAVGAFAATVKYQGDAISENSKNIAVIQSEVISNDKEHVKFDMIRNDIKEIKEDIKDIKKIILKPAIP